MTEIREAKLGDYEPLLELAREDNHAVIRPTHVMLKDGELIGYASVGGVPLVIFYMNTKKAKATNTFRFERHCEELVRHAGSPLVCAPCSPSSPIYPFMPKLGFVSGGNMDVFIKKL